MPLRSRGEKRVTVLHVVEAIGAGVARHVTDVVRLVCGVDHEIAVPASRVGWDTDLEAEVAMRDAGATIHRVEMRRSPPHPVNARAWLTLSELIRDRRPAVVHGHAAIGGALARLAAWSVPARRVYTPHGVLVRPAVVAAERILGRRTHHLIALSESERDLITSLRLVSPDRIELIPNGIDVDAPPGPIFDLRRELRLAGDVPLVGSVGRLGPQKAPEVFVEACRQIATRLPDVHFVLVGAGPLAPQVSIAVKEAGLSERLHLVTHVPGMGRLMGQLDVFALTSRYEGLPYVLIEAMRARVPVVATDVVGSRDAVEHGVTGLLVPPEDPAAVSVAVCRLLAEPDVASGFGDAGNARMQELFDVRRMADALEELYLRSAPITSGAR